MPSSLQQEQGDTAVTPAGARKVSFLRTYSPGPDRDCCKAGAHEIFYEWTNKWMNKWSVLPHLSVLLPSLGTYMSVLLFLQPGHCVPASTPVPGYHLGCDVRGTRGRFGLQEDSRMLCRWDPCWAEAEAPQFSPGAATLSSQPRAGFSDTRLSCLRRSRASQWLLGPSPTSSTSFPPPGQRSRCLSKICPYSKFLTPVKLVADSISSTSPNPN